MDEVRFDAGEVVFREGEPSRAVLLIAAGEVEVLKAMPGGHVLLGRAGAGEVVGEMGVLEGRPRSATVRALVPVAGELLEHDAFLARISGDPELAYTALLRLSARLRAANEWLAEASHAPVAAESRHVTLAAAPAAGVALVAALPAGGVAVERFPFVVGRRPAEDEPDPGLPADLALDEEVPYRLSRRHFAIVQTAEGGLAIEDAQSRLGTAVNGEPIGGPFFRSRARLHRGENSVVAGGEGSPFVFSVNVG